MDGDRVSEIIKKEMQRSEKRKEVLFYVTNGISAAALLISLIALLTRLLQ